MEFFLEKISDLTPHSNQNKNRFYVKKAKTLDTTKQHYNESQSLTRIELKESKGFSLPIRTLTDVHLENVFLKTCWISMIPMQT